MFSLQRKEYELAEKMTEKMTVLEPQNFTGSYYLHLSITEEGETREALDILLKRQPVFLTRHYISLLAHIIPAF